MDFGGSFAEASPRLIRSDERVIRPLPLASGPTSGSALRQAGGMTDTVIRAKSYRGTSNVAGRPRSRPPGGIGGSGCPPWPNGRGPDNYPAPRMLAYANQSRASGACQPGGTGRAVPTPPPARPGCASASDLTTARSFQQSRAEHALRRHLALASRHQYFPALDSDGRGGLGSCRGGAECSHRPESLARLWSKAIAP